VAGNVEAKSAAFQSTPFARRETNDDLSFTSRECVSIHSLRKKGDYEEFKACIDRVGFNPLPLQKGRP